MYHCFSDKTSAVPSNEELEELEKSLAMANRDLKSTKDSIYQTSPLVDQSASSQQQQQQPQLHHHLQQQQTSHSSILDDADDITRQIAEEILKQNIGTGSGISESSVCNGDAQESIKAIARSLSTSGMLLTSDLNQRSQSQDLSVIQGQTMSLSRSQPLNPYSCVGQVFHPPTMALQSTPQTRTQQLPFASSTGLTKSPVSVSTPGQVNIVPRNVTVLPQGLFQAQLPVSTPSVQQSVVSTPVTTVNSGLNALPRPVVTTGMLNFQSGQSLTAHQLSQLVQQAARQLPPVPPYIPRPATTVSPTVVTQQPVAMTTVQSTSSALSQQQLQVQQLVQQREQLTQQQQHLLTQQLLQQHLLALAQQQSQQSQLSQKLPTESLVNIQHQQQGLISVNKTQPLLTPNVNISALLQQSQRINHLHTMSSVTPVQVPQLVKTNFTTAQQVVTSSILAQVTLPTANIVWTAPPNVTITSSNGFSRNVVQGTGNITSTVATTSAKLKHVDAVIDLTDSNDAPVFPTNEKARTTVTQSSFPSQTALSPQGKS